MLAHYVLRGDGFSGILAGADEPAVGPGAGSVLGDVRARLMLLYGSFDER